MSLLTANAKMKTRRASYTTAEKLRVVRYAEAHGNRKAGREHGMDESVIRGWRRNKARLENLPSTKRADRGGPAHYPQLDAKVLDFVSERRKCGVAISTVELRLMALHASQQDPSLVLGAPFKASAGWAYRFMKRSGLSVRRRTTLAQKLPDDLDDKIISFQRYILALRKKHDYPQSMIGNADQTPLTFDLPMATTLDYKGTKTVSIRTTGNEKNRFTVMLACMADGTKLPPYVIFKRKTMPKEKFPTGVIVRVQEKGWMNEALTADWIRTVWGSRGLLGRKMLVLDSFRAHRTPAIKQQLKETRTDLVIIPGGLTSLLQPLDVAVNRPFKCLLEKRWNSWMMDKAAHTFTATGRQRRPELVEICQWIYDAWQELDVSCIVNGFKKCSISNAMDGTEDDMLWEEPTQQPEETSLEPELESAWSYYDDFDGADSREIEALFAESDDEEFLGFTPEDLIPRK